MKEGMYLKDYLDQLNTLLIELRNIDIKIKDEDTTLLLLVSLPLSYENFVQSFVVRKDTVSLEEVRSSLHTRELRQMTSSSGVDNSGSGLIATSSNKGRGCFERNDKKGKRRSKSKARHPNPRDICNYCKKPGH